MVSFLQIFIFSFCFLTVETCGTNDIFFFSFGLIDCIFDLFFCSLSFSHASYIEQLSVFVEKTCEISKNVRTMLTNYIAVRLKKNVFFEV